MADTNVSSKDFEDSVFRLMNRIYDAIENMPEADPRKKLAQALFKYYDTKGEGCISWKVVNGRFQKEFEEALIAADMPFTSFHDQNGNLLLLVRDCDEQEFLRLQDDIFKRHTDYYKEADMEAFLRNESRYGSIIKEFTFDDREECENFKNKAYSEGHGMVAAYTYDEEAGKYKAYVSVHDAYHPGHQSDLYSTLLRAKAQTADPVRESLSRAKREYDAKALDDMVERIKNGEEFCVMNGLDPRGDYLKISDGVLQLYHYDEQKQVFLNVRTPVEIPKVWDAQTLDAFRSAFSASAAEVHNKTAMDLTRAGQHRAKSKEDFADTILENQRQTAEALFRPQMMGYDTADQALAALVEKGVRPELGDKIFNETEQKKRYYDSKEFAQERDDLDRNIEDKEDFVKSKQEKLSGLEEEEQSLEETLAKAELEPDFTGNITAKQEEIAILQKQLETASPEEVAQIQNKLAAARTEVQTLQAKQDVRGKNIESIRAALEDKRVELAPARESLTKTKTELAELKEKALNMDFDKEITTQTYKELTVYNDITKKTKKAMRDVLWKAEENMKRLPDYSEHASEAWKDGAYKSCIMELLDKGELDSLKEMKEVLDANRGDGTYRNFIDRTKGDYNDVRDVRIDVLQQKYELERKKREAELEAKAEKERADRDKDGKDGMEREDD